MPNVMIHHCDAINVYYLGRKQEVNLDKLVLVAALLYIEKVWLLLTACRNHPFFYYWPSATLPRTLSCLEAHGVRCWKADKLSVMMSFGWWKPSNMDWCGWGWYLWVSPTSLWDDDDAEVEAGRPRLRVVWGKFPNITLAQRLINLDDG